MQITFSTTEISLTELKALTLMLGSLCGMRVIDPTTGETTAPAPQPLPAADLPTTGTDTQAMGFGAQPQLPNLTPPTPPAVVTNAGAAAGLPALPSIALGQGGAVELDAAGLPHDPRIHAGTKRKNADGTWTKKKGLNDASLIARVEAELRATLPSATPAPTNVQPLFPQPTVTPAAAPAPALPPLPLAPTTTPQPAPVAPVIAQGAPSALPALAPLSPAPTNMQEFMQQVAPLMQAGKVTADTITMACMQNNLPGMAGLSTADSITVAKVWEALPK